MFFNRKSRDELFEARIEDLKEAHEARVKELMRLVDALAEQVEYLRAQIGRPFIQAQHRGVNPAELLEVGPDELDVPKHVSEEEEDLRALREMGHLDEWEFEALKGQLPTLNLSRD